MKVKSLLLIAALLTSSLMLISPVAAPTNKFYLSPAEQSGHVGGTVSFNVMIDSFSNLNAYQFALRWDQSVLKFKNIMFVWLHTQGTTDNAYTVSIVGNELTASEWLMNPDQGVSGTDKVFATIEWDIVAGGSTWINFTECRYWLPGGEEVTCTSGNGFFFTEEPFVDFFWTPERPRKNEWVTFNASPCFSPEGLGISYQWFIDGVDAGTEVTATATFTGYSKTPHNITLVVTDSEGDSFKVQKNLKIDRDIAIFSIWPSIEDYMGSIVPEIPSGKTVVIMVRIANIGTITEYTDNSKGDFPSTTKLILYLVHPDGTEEPIDSRAGKSLRRYRWAENETYWYYKYDWAPLVGVYQWFFWYSYGYAPGNYILKAKFDPGLEGDTDSSNDELTFPIKIVHGYEHDVMIDWVYTYDDVDYIHPYPPFPGTTFKYFYGPYPPGSIATVTVGLFNIGKFLADTNIDGSVDASDLGEMGSAWGAFLGDPNYNSWCDIDGGPGAQGDGTIDAADLGTMGAEWGWIYEDKTVIVHILAGDEEVAVGSITLTFGEWNEITLEWNTTGFFGTYTVQAWIEPVTGENPEIRWNVWDNNLPELVAQYGIMFPLAYDDWGIYETFP